MAAPSTRNIVPLLPTAAAPAADYAPAKPIIIVQAIRAALRARRF